MTAGTKRRVRVILEGEAHEVSQRCDLLRVELDKGGEQGGASFLLNPAWPDVTVEDVTPSYAWRDGDAVQSLFVNAVWYRDDGTWCCRGLDSGRTDTWATERVKGNTLRVLRYQAGEA